MGRTPPATETACRLWAPDELAEHLGVPLQTVYSWRTSGRGPRGIRVGKHLRFRREDVDAWLEQQADPVPAA